MPTKEQKNRQGRPKSGKVSRQFSVTPRMLDYIEREKYPWEDVSHALERLFWKGQPSASATYSRGEE